MGWIRGTDSKEGKNNFISKQGNGYCFLGCKRNYIIYIDYLENGKTNTGQYYAELLQCLEHEMQIKRPHLARKKILFHHNNAPVHSSIVDMAKINELKFELMPHPPYSPDLTSSDYYLFPNFKKWLGGKRFGSNKEVIDAKSIF